MKMRYAETETPRQTKWPLVRVLSWLLLFASFALLILSLE